jgi:hypothetical protein
VLLISEPKLQKGKRLQIRKIFFIKFGVVKEASRISYHEWQQLMERYGISIGPTNNISKESQPLEKQKPLSI